MSDHPYLPLLGVLVGAIISAVISLHVSSRAAKAQRDIAEKSAAHARRVAEEADIRRAAREDAVRARQQKDEMLKERFQLQTNVFDAYTSLIVKYLRPLTPTERRDGAWEHQSHAEAADLYLRIVLAFGDENFATQAVRVLEGVPATMELGNELHQFEAERLCQFFVGEMLDCMKATIGEMGGPPHARPPTPLATREEFADAIKRARVVDMLDRHRVTGEQRADMLNAFEQALKTKRAKAVVES